ncbi:MAG: class I SAM-dependent methyltransferase [Eubacteriales bacterium]|nr:class I SAM-dependent methyltransferase [Eubacteriales bacterium]
MELSARLAGVASLAKDAETLADIGTDHAYLPIWLMQQGTLTKAIAMDINPGPLARARENINRYGMQELIKTRRSDGARELLPGEVDTVVIAGMGGALTVRILTDGAKMLAGTKNFILQPQSEIAGVRRFLHEQGFCIVQEHIVKDDGKYYFMMKAVRGEQAAWEDYEYSYGKCLLDQKDACLWEFLEKEERKQCQILERLQAAGAGCPEKTEDARICGRREEVIGELEKIVRAKARFASDDCETLDR